jgi:uncharacterized membrane protein
MEPAVVVAGLWMLFGGTHIAMGTDPVRSLLVERFGERRFTVIFSLLATASFAALVSYYAAHRFEGLQGLALGHIGQGAGGSIIRWISWVGLIAAFALMFASLVSYPRSPYALLSRNPIRPPRGIDRLSRHGFFAGVALFALVHVLLATRLVGTVFAAGFGILALLGAWHQDRKLLARHGEPYADYLSATSTIPFAAILSGRQQLIMSDLPVRTLAAGAGLALVLRGLHDHMFAWGGLLFVMAVVGGGWIELLQSVRRSRRQPAMPAHPPSSRHPPG